MSSLSTYLWTAVVTLAVAVQLFIYFKEPLITITFRKVAPNYKLAYFDLPGRAEATRLLFAYGGVKYEDFRFSFEDWPKYKPETPYGQVPVLEIDGKKFPQSKAHARYAARVVQLAGNNELEDLEIDSVVDTIADFEQKLFDAVYSEKDETKKEQLLKKVTSENVPFYFSKLDAVAKANGGHLALKRLTWADLYFINTFESAVNYLKKDVFVDYPNLLAVKKTVLSNPAIKEYIKKRPANPMFQYDLKQDV